MLEIAKNNRVLPRGLSIRLVDIELFYNIPHNSKVHKRPATTLRPEYQKAGDSDIQHLLLDQVEILKREVKSCQLIIL